MTLLKSSFFSAIETAIKFVSGFIVLRLLALKIGPQGVAFFGQFQNLFAAFVILISGSFTIGLVRFSAEDKKANQTLPGRYAGNALGLGLIVATLVSLFLCLFAQRLSILTMGTSACTFVFYLLAIFTFWILIYQILLAVFNGWGELKKLLLCKISSSLILIAGSIVLIPIYGVIGALIALVIMQALAGMIALGLLIRTAGFEWSWLTPRFDFILYQKFLHYWLMSLVTLMSTPLVLLLIRNHIVQKLGWETAGFWEASWKISELYLVVITTALSTWYVPGLSRSTGYKEDKTIVKKVLIWGVSAALGFATAIYFFREWVLSVLFTTAFLPVSTILGFQLSGSVLRIAAWVFSYHMIVRSKIKCFVISECLFGLSFYLLSCVFFDSFGLIGLSYAFFVNCFCYLLYGCLYFFVEQQIQAVPQSIFYRFKASS